MHQGYREILDCEGSVFHYRKFEKSIYYPYLIRNISFHINSANEGIENYDYTLEQFKGKDVINYNRTLSNYLCYLMKHRFDETAISRLKVIAKNVYDVLLDNDPQYIWLNINYGLYLMLITEGDPHEYFDRIPYEPVTTETPYIFAQINKAMCYAKGGNAQFAIEMLDNINNDYITKTSVPHTEGFYYVNRSLAEYINDGEYMKYVKEITVSRLRGDKNYVNFLQSNYKRASLEEVKYSPGDWDQLFKPGYIFYRQFDPALLFPDLV